MGALNEDMRWDNGDVFQTRSGSWIERLNQLHDHRAQSEWDVFVFFCSSHGREMSQRVFFRGLTEVVRKWFPYSIGVGKRTDRLLSRRGDFDVIISGCPEEVIEMPCACGQTCQADERVDIHDFVSFANGLDHRTTCWDGGIYK